MKLWTKLVRILFTSPEFKDAWEEVGDTGLKSVWVLRKQRERLLQSKKHTEVITHVTNVILSAAADWADEEATATTLSRQERTRTFALAIGQEVLSVAAGFTMQGTMVGFLTALKIQDRGENQDNPDINSVPCETSLRLL
jgi:hypothetical protein